MTKPVDVSVDIIGLSPRPVMYSSCEYSEIEELPFQLGRQILYFTKSTSAGNQKVKLQNIEFQGGLILGHDFELYVENCTFVNSTLHLVSSKNEIALDWPLELDEARGTKKAHVNQSIGCSRINVTIIDTQWSFQSIANPSTVAEAAGFDLDIYFMCSEVHLLMTRCFLANRRLLIFATGMLNLTLDSLEARGNPTGEHKVGGVTVVMPNNRGNIHVRHSVFANLIPDDILFGRLFSKTFSTAPIYFTSYTDSIPPSAVDDGSIIIHNCTFFRNQRALLLGPLKTKVSVSNCHFESNHVAVDGGAISTSAANVQVSDSQFCDNEAASFTRYQKVSGSAQLFIPSYESVVRFYEVSRRVLKTTVSTSNATNIRIIAYGLAGGGGAIFVNAGTVAINGCRFINNSAHDAGGAIRLMNTAGARITNCYMTNSPNISNVLEGFMVFSVGRFLIIENTTFDAVLDYESNIDSSAIFYFGTRQKCELRGVAMRCPEGFKLYVYNSTSKNVQDGANDTHLYDTLYYSCEQCPAGSYSFDKSSINVPYNGETGRDTIMFNQVDCAPCPYGGNCASFPVAKANFWGSCVNKSLVFFRCPKSYCCQLYDCGSYSGCSANRTGRLCGACPAGYTQALFSSKCVDSSRCYNPLVLVIVIGFVMFYTTFLMFQKDFTIFLFSSHGVFFMFRTCWKSGAISNISESKGNVLTLDNGGPRENEVKPSEERDQPSLGIGEINTAFEMTETPRNPTAEPNDPNKPSSKNQPVPKKVAVGGSFVVILFYYFQDAALMKVQTVYVESSQLLEDIETVMSQVFRFQFNFFSFTASNVCMLPGINVRGRDLLLAFFAPLIVLLLVFVYVLSKVGYKRTSNEAYKRMEVRATSALILGVLFSYQRSATTAFSFLYCVPVLGKSVLFIDGTIECYELWQWATWAYTICCIVPFSLHLAIAPPLLERGRISFMEFVVASFLPLPFLLSWTRFLFQAPNRKTYLLEKSLESDTVHSTLQAPYRQYDLPGMLKSLCWSGVIMTRRLLLMLSHTLIVNVLLRNAAMLTVTVVALIHHVHVRPYVDPLFNLAGGLSGGALVVVGSVNLLRAAFEVAEYVPQGQELTFMRNLNFLESLVLVWIPLVGLGLVVANVLLRLTLSFLCFVVVQIRSCKQKCKHGHE